YTKKHRRLPVPLFFSSGIIAFVTSRRLAVYVYFFFATNCIRHFFVSFVCLTSTLTVYVVMLSNAYTMRTYLFLPGSCLLSKTAEGTK
ncbi:hypothetical protein BX070DRAFT_218141, partial [Coemansia spiralis]